MSICSKRCSSALMQTPKRMRQRRETVEHPFGTMKARMGATHFLTKTLPKVAAEMALSVLAYNLTRVMNIVGVRPNPTYAVVGKRRTLRRAQERQITPRFFVARRLRPFPRRATR